MDRDAIKIRTALIERVRKYGEKTISYSELVEVAGTKLLLTLEEDRLRLITLLTQIFEYEHHAQPRRPLLTIMTTYMHGDDRGGEFYKLVAKYGYERDLKTNEVAMLKRMEAVVEFWRDDLKYRQYKDVSVTPAT